MGFSMAFVPRQTRQTPTLAMAAFAALAFAGALETSPAAAWNAAFFLGGYAGMLHPKK